MKAYKLPESGYDSPIDKLKAWRKANKFSSQHQLSDELSRRIKAEYSPNPAPDGSLIHQPDVSRAEQGFPGPFTKVTAAICRLYGLPEDYFGQITVAPQAFREESAKYEADLKNELIVCQRRMIEMMDTISALHDKLLVLTEENARLRTRLSMDS